MNAPIKLTHQLYNDCKEVGMSDAQIALKFNMAYAEFESRIKKWGYFNSDGKLTVMKYVNHLRRNMKLKNMASKYRISEKEILKKVELWDEIGILDKANELIGSKKISLVEFVTLREEGLTQSQISRKMGISLSNISVRKKEWRELGFIDENDKAITGPLVTLNLPKYRDYIKKGFNNEQISNVTGISLGAIKTYKESWERIGLLKKNSGKTQSKVTELTNLGEIDKSIHKEAFTIFKKDELETEVVVLKNTIKKLEKELEQEKRLKDDVLNLAKEFEGAIGKALRAVEFYGNSEFEYASKLGLMEIKKILEPAIYEKEDNDA